MGRTVINETENKQTVILNDSPEGVEGGYFDANMKWHELGESTFPVEIEEGDPFFNFGGADWTQPHSANGSYVTAATSQSTLTRRIHAFNDFAMFYKITPGDVVKISTSSPFIGVDGLLESGYSKAKRQEAIAESDRTGTGWQAVENGEFIFDSSLYPGTVAIALEFKKDSAGTGSFSSLNEVLPLKLEIL